VNAPEPRDVVARALMGHVYKMNADDSGYCSAGDWEFGSSFPEHLADVALAALAPMLAQARLDGAAEAYSDAAHEVRHEARWMVELERRGLPVADPVSRLRLVEGVLRARAEVQRGEGA